MASAYLQNTTTTATNALKIYWSSFWIKLSKLENGSGLQEL